MNNNIYFERIQGFKELFWNMFIVDAFINNNDRNDNNWGLILNRNTMDLRIAPIYDNGAAFYSKFSDERIATLLSDEFKMKQVIYDSCISTFTQNGKIINPLKFIESMINEDCNKALLRIFPKINLAKIETLFDDIPLSYNDLSVFSKQQRELYYKSLEYKYKRVFEPTYNRLLTKISGRVA